VGWIGHVVGKHAGFAVLQVGKQLGSTGLHVGAPGQVVGEQSGLAASHVEPANRVDVPASATAGVTAFIMTAVALLKALLPLSRRSTAELRAAA